MRKTKETFKLVIMGGLRMDVKGVKDTLKECKCEDVHFERCSRDSKEYNCEGCKKNPRMCITTEEIETCECDYVALSVKDVKGLIGTGRRKSDPQISMYNPKACVNRKMPSVDYIFIVQIKDAKKEKHRIVILIEVKHSAAVLSGILEKYGKEELQRKLLLILRESQENQSKRILKTRLKKCKWLRDYDRKQLERHFSAYIQLESTKKWLQTQGNKQSEKSKGVKIVSRVIIGGEEVELYPEGDWCKEIAEYNRKFRSYPKQSAKDLLAEKGCICSVICKEEEVCKTKKKFWMDIMREGQVPGIEL